MGQIEYCDVEVKEPSWHPMFASEGCADPREDWSLAFVDSWTIEEAVEDPLKAEFQMLADRWKRETAIHGHLTKIIMHPDYQRIMAMGPEIVPYILEDLSRQLAHWFWALHNLVPPGHDPAEGLTTMSDARQAWLEWGRDNDYL
jgi:hypothetical protein